MRWPKLVLTGAVSLITAPVQTLTSKIEKLELAPASSNFSELDPIQLAEQDPIGFLRQCQQRASSVKGYRAILIKQERIGDQLYPVETIDAAIREEPFAIQLVWREGARKVLGSEVRGILFVAGENQGNMKVWRPSAFLPIVEVGTVDTNARRSARYALNEGGVKDAMKRTLAGWMRARLRGKLNVKYQGRQSIPELGGRVCDVFLRTCDPPEVDGFLMSDPPRDWQETPEQAVKTLTIMLDVETGLQLGSELRRSDGELIGKYFFHLQELDPVFAPAQFTVTGFPMSKRR